MDRRQDPRTIVTPYAFSVHPDLLGRPLATPWQRLGAISIDLVVVFGLTRIGGVWLAVATGLLLFWLAVRKPAQDTMGKAFRGFAGCLGVTILSGTVLFIGGMHLLRQLENDPGAQEDLRAKVSEIAGSVGIEVGLNAEGGPDSLRLADLVSIVPNLFALRRAENGEQAREIARSIATAAREEGLPLQEIRLTLAELMPDDASWSGEGEDIIDEIMGELRRGLSEGPLPAEIPATRSTEAYAITDSMALDSIATLNNLVLTLDEERRDVEAELTRTETQLEEAESRGILDRLKNLIDDLGLGFGWAALYLTIIHAWWNGRSIGKKIFRTRVVMIDNRPLNWWLSFERAGGYAAGFATGLLGFAQIFWDPNRQAIHDKVSETMVIQDGKDPVPGPWIIEGKAQWERGRPPDAPGRKT